ncbi:MAG: YveK family protein [Eubacteriales bacterium]
MEEFEKVEEIDLKESWFIFRRNLKFIALIVLISVVLTGVVTLFILDKQYESYSTLMLGKPKDYGQDSNSEITYNDMLLNQKLVSTYSEIIKSKAVTTKVINELNLNMSTEALGNIVAVTTLNDTEIIKITVKHTDAREASRIANAMANTFMDYVSDLMKIDNVNVIDVAVVNNDPVSPRLKMNLAIALVLGLMLGIFIVFLREFMDTKIKDPKEIESLSKHPVLAVIPNSKLLG